MIYVTKVKSLLNKLHPVLHPFREVLQSAHHVRRQTLVDLLGIGETEAGHQSDELLLGLRQTWVVLLLFTNRGASQP